jgi:proteasome assembly chaperone (PAC2) family protein
VDSLTWEGDLPHLRSPVLVCAFRGWNDAAAAASTALGAIASSFDSELIAKIDPEDYFDFQSTRPTIVLTEGQARRIEWPENNLVAVRVPNADRDLVLLDGTEPNLRWRTFSETIATAADALGVELVITLGALIAEVSHTLPVPITGLASDQHLVEELELERSNYEGPTGIVGVVHDLCRQAGIDSASLWAAVPHYVAAVPNPKAALALLRRLEGLTGIAVEASELERLRGADRPRDRRQPGDRGAGRADRGRTGRPADRGGRGAALGRHDRERVPAFLEATRRRPLSRAAPRFQPPGRSGGSRTSRRRWGRGAARSPD